MEYVFTDKTGTLTENEMQFRECSINGVKYQEINSRLVPEGMTEDVLDAGSVSHLVIKNINAQRTWCEMMVSDV